MTDHDERGRFYSHIRIGPDPLYCYEWTGCTYNGYGRVMFRRRVTQAHRAAWILEGREIPKGMCLLHSCDNRLCVNVSHLRIGTRADNLRDMYEKGRENLVGLKIRQQKRTHCKHGHAFTSENTGKDRGKWQRCRACWKAKSRRQRDAKR